MGNKDVFEPGAATPAECMRKARSLRLMARMLDPGFSHDRAYRLADLWDQRAEEQRPQAGDDGKT